MTRLVCLFVFLLAVAVSGQQGADQTLAGLKPAPGLAVTLFAAEPNVENPTDLTVDERGRVWVLEGVNYRRQSRMQPDLRPEGDRIVILEDTDNDGKSDRTKVFDQGPHIRVPLGIAVLGDKVYVSQSPDITVYTKDAERQHPQEGSPPDGFRRRRSRPRTARGGLRTRRQAVLQPWQHGLRHHGQVGPALRVAGHGAGRQPRGLLPGRRAPDESRRHRPRNPLAELPQSVRARRRFVRQRLPD